MHAGENLDQRRFPGAIFTEQSVNLAGPDREIDLIQRDHARESFADSA